MHLPVFVPPTAGAAASPFSRLKPPARPNGHRRALRGWTQVVAVRTAGRAPTLRPRPLGQRQMLEAEAPPALRSLAPGPGAGPTRRGANRCASHEPGTDHRAAAPIRRGRPRGGKGPHAPRVRFCALLWRGRDSRFGRGLRRRDRPLSSTVHPTVVERATLRRRRTSDSSSLRPLAVDKDVLLDIGAEEAAMAAETYCGQLTATTKIVDSGGPEPEQIGDLLLRKDVRPFERAVAPRRAHGCPRWLAGCARCDRKPPPGGAASASARWGLLGSRPPAGSDSRSPESSGLPRALEQRETRRTPGRRTEPRRTRAWWRAKARVAGRALRIAVTKEGRAKVRPGRREGARCPEQRTIASASFSRTPYSSLKRSSTQATASRAPTLETASATCGHPRSTTRA